MLNFRKLKKDFPSHVMDEGRALFTSGKVDSAHILDLDPMTVRVCGRVQGQYDNHYEAEIEIDREECEVIDSNCDCPYNYDCQHLAALLHYIEENFDKILALFSKQADLSELEENEEIDDSARQELIDKLKEAESKEEQKLNALKQRQVLDEYVRAADTLARSPFFQARTESHVDRAELALIYQLDGDEHPEKHEDIEVQLALRLPQRSKPLYVPNIKEFVEAIQYEEMIVMAGKKYSFSSDSFDPVQWEILKIVLAHVRPREQVASDRGYRIGYLKSETFGLVLARAYELAVQNSKAGALHGLGEDFPQLPAIFMGSLEEPLLFSPNAANFRFHLEFMKPPVNKILLKPFIKTDEREVGIEDVDLFECAKPGMIHSNVYSRFASYITRTHLRSLEAISEMAIPQPLFGSFVENALPEMTRMASVAGREVLEQFVTLPYVGKLKASCELTFLDGELDAEISFDYDGKRVPASSAALKHEEIEAFLGEEGILARSLVEERKLIEELFQDFTYNRETGVFVTRSEKKIVEFMTDVVPRFSESVDFQCPQNLLDQFIYDSSDFELSLSETESVDKYKIEMRVDGALQGVCVDLLWDCMASKRAFIELESGGSGRMPKVLVLDLERIGSVIQVFDELGIEVLDNHTIERPLWSLANVEASHFEELPVKFSISDRLLEIRSQMLGQKDLIFSPIPKDVKAKLRSYQVEGVQWLERLRSMYLSGILADDMGLGKTLQAICAINQLERGEGKTTLIVCPTSLLYNWKEEFAKFSPHMKVMVVDGIPNQRKKLISKIEKYDVIVTSYTLLQKDVDHYEKTTFEYAILDEAQHIKNRGTRNAKSVKMVAARHRLILSGTPIENSLDEMWSLFDFLMPGFLSTYDRFVEKYVRTVGDEHVKNIEYLRKKVSPFIMRRMKADVLHDLPPVQELIYHCKLSQAQRELYKAHAESARDELSKLVERDGFDRVQIHVLATLTRLKQICCHPAIFAKNDAEIGDSAKYDMLLELLQTLTDGGHKTVIFSQYTRMLKIMRSDFEKMGIKFCYLDGSTKNRLEIVKEFNADASIKVFLISLKAGGTGLNLTSADTVIHYDMWWNPAVESQATDRVHRMGQTRSVSTYKLITLGTIEEKIAEMQNRKKGLVKKVVSCDDEAISKLTWEDVLELLKT